jgi:RHS repeat-associated protein
VTRRTYDGEGRVLSVTDPEGDTTQMRYDPTGNVLSEIDARGFVTKHSYDAQARKFRTQYADNTSEFQSYDAEGQVTAESDRAGGNTNTVFDLLGRQTQVTQTGGQTPAMVSKTTFDAAGQVKEQIDALGNKTTFTYDLAGRRKTTTDPLGQVSSVAYDAAGQMLGSTDALNRTTTSSFDAAGRRTSVTHPDGSIERTRYDAAGRAIEQTDALNRKTTMQYDQNGRLIGVLDAAGGVTSYAYDGLGSRTHQIDALNRQTRFGYDASGRMISRTLPLGQMETTQYDRVGNVISTVGFRGNTISHGYDGAGKLIEKRSNDGRSWTFAYSSTRLVNILNQQTGQQSTRSSNGLGQLLLDSEELWIRTQNTFDARGLRTSAEAGNFASGYGPTRKTQYGYDAKGRLNTVTDWESKLTTIAYDAVDRPVSISYADGSVETRGYDLRDRLVEIKTTKAGSNLTTFNYQYDAAGQITSELATIAGLIRNTAYSYDALSRLTRAQITETNQPNTTLVWTYDAVGNRLTQAQTTGAVTVNTAYSYDANDRLLSETTDQSPVQRTSYSYDDSGNVLRKLITSGLAPTTTTLADTRYQWDAQDRLIQVTEDAHTTSPKVTKQIYNGFDERIAEIIPGTGNDASRTKTYTLDHSFGNAQVVEERRANSIIAHHTLMPFQNAQGVMRISEVRGDGTGSQQGVIVNPVWHRYITDQQSTTRALIDQNSALTDQISFLPFGEVQRRTGTTATPFQYTGEQQAPAGMTYLRARFMDPRQGRFLGMDPYAGNLRNPLSLNKFNYVHSNPVMGVDPTGMMALASVAVSAPPSGAVRAARISAVRSPNVTRAMLQPAANDAIYKTGGSFMQGTVVRMVATLAAYALKSSNGPRRSALSGLPIVVHGEADMPQTAEHIWDAQWGDGMTINGTPHAPITALLARSERDQGAWYDSYAPCKGRSVGSGTTCDEYPFGSTIAGGSLMYRMGLVSLRLVNRSEQNLQRDLIRNFYTIADVKRFGVSPRPSLPKTRI